LSKPSRLEAIGPMPILEDQVVQCVPGDILLINEERKNRRSEDIVVSGHCSIPADDSQQYPNSSLVADLY